MEICEQHITCALRWEYLLNLIINLIRLVRWGIQKNTGSGLDGAIEQYIALILDKRRVILPSPYRDKPTKEGEAVSNYPHMCRDDHDEIGYSGDSERCPVCRMRDELEAENARLTAVNDMLWAVNETKERNP